MRQQADSLLDDNEVNMKEEKGLLIVEATIVFPIIFFVIMFLFFAGNMFWQKSRIESIVSRMTIDGAVYCGDSGLPDIICSYNYGGKTDIIPSLGAMNINLYDIVSGKEDVEIYIDERIKSQIEKLDSGFFYGMVPRLESVSFAEYERSFIHASFKVAVSYRIYMPFRVWGQSENMSIRLTTMMEYPVMDTVEFIRNINMIEDYYENSGLESNITELVESAKDFFEGDR